jgi:2-polyprenyl-3-methyl-5-hydroxy-6-metoxy-1,4-benzoquinol methylase
VTTSRDDWDQHWQDYSETAEQNPAQNYRRELILSLLGVQGSGEGVRIIDIGSGQGDMAAAIQARFPSAQILGLELAQAGVEISRRKVPAARFVQRNLLDATEPAEDLSGWATHAICSEVVEHLDNPSVLLRNARAYMADGCCFIVTVPGGPMSAFDKHIGHRKHWREKEIKDLLTAAEFIPEYISGVGFPFFNLYRCLVILRGRKLITDVSAGSHQTSPAARLVMSLFSRVMKMHLNSSRWGWQMVAKVRAGSLKSKFSC